MNKSIYITITLIFLFLTSCEEKNKQNDILGFNNLLGKEKSESMTQAVLSFDRFLNTNYPKTNSDSSQIKSFLKQIMNDQNSHSNPSFILDKNDCEYIIELWEKSGLRKEIWTYENENYNVKYDIRDLLHKKEKDSLPLQEVFLIEEDDNSWNIPMDSLEYAKRLRETEISRENSLYSNSYGKFLYGLAKFTPNDKFIQDYVNSKFYSRDMSPIVFLHNFIENTENFEDPFFKMIIVTEYYYWIIKVESKI